MRHIRLMLVICMSMSSICTPTEVPCEPVSVQFATNYGGNDLIDDILGSDTTADQLKVDFGPELKPWQIALGQCGFKLLETYAKLRTAMRRLWRSMGTYWHIQQ